MEFLPPNVINAVFALRKQRIQITTESVRDHLNLSPTKDNGIRSVFRQMSCLGLDNFKGKNIRVINFDPFDVGATRCETESCVFTKSGTSGCDRYRSLRGVRK